MTSLCSVYSVSVFFSGEQSIILCWPGLFSGSNGASLANNSFICNPFVALQALCGDERCPTGAPSSPLFGNFIYTASIHEYIYIYTCM